MWKDHLVKKKPPSTRRRVLIIDVLSGQEDPDVLWKLENHFCLLFLNSDGWNPQSKLAIRGTVSAVQLASGAINVDQEPVVNCRAGGLDPRLKCAVQRKTWIQRAAARLEARQSYLSLKREAPERKK